MSEPRVGRQEAIEVNTVQVLADEAEKWEAIADELAATLVRPGYQSKTRAIARYDQAKAER